MNIFFNGADISAINENMYLEKFSHYKFKVSSFPKAYDGEPINININTKCFNYEGKDLKLFPFKNDSHSILGRAWYKPLQITLEVNFDKNTFYCTLDVEA